MSAATRASRSRSASSRPAKIVIRAISSAVTMSGTLRQEGLLLSLRTTRGAAIVFYRTRKPLNHDRAAAHRLNRSSIVHDSVLRGIAAA